MRPGAPRPPGAPKPPSPFAPPSSGVYPPPASLRSGGTPQPPPDGGYPVPPPYAPEQPRKKRTRLIVTLAIAGVVVLGLVIFGVVTGLNQGAERNDSGQITSAGNLSAFDVKVGDCFDLPDPNGEVTDLSGVPCTDPHDAEVYATFDIDGQDFPGTDKVIAEAERGCSRRFKDFVGLPYRRSELELQYLYPTSDSWDTQNDREVVCAVTEPDGKKTTVETLQDAKR